MNYEFEYKYIEHNNQYKEFKVPISRNIDNTQYKQDQIGLLKEMFPNGINKQIKMKDENQLEFYTGDN